MREDGEARGHCHLSLNYRAVVLGLIPGPLQPVFPTLCLRPYGKVSWEGGARIHLDHCLSLPLNEPLFYLGTSVIRHVAPIPSHYDVQDRFRIELSEEGAEGRVVGRKDITSVLRAPAYPLELQGLSDPTPHPGPSSWTAPPTARHLPESELEDGNS